jgi:hypothetical protein
MTQPQEPTAKAVQDCHNLLAWIIPQLDKFPKNRRYTLGERIESGLLDVLEALLEAAYSRNKAEPLGRANRRLDLIRHLWRLAHTLQAIPLKPYEHGATRLLDLGRQIGAWRKGQASPDGRGPQ